MASVKFDIEVPTCREGVFVPVPFAGPEQIVDTVERAEALGYHAVWATDFIAPTPCYMIPDDDGPPSWYEPMVTLAYCAARTTRIKLGTGIIMLPLREPVLLAKQVATLDRLSGGRFLLGVGLGMCRDEFDAILPRQSQGAHRGRLFEENIEVLQGLLAPGQDAVTFAGDHAEIQGINLNPKPAQERMTIYVPGHNDAALERVARLGLGFMVPAAVAANRMAALEPVLERHGRALADIDVIAEGEIRLADTREQAISDHGATRQMKFRSDRGQDHDAVVGGQWIGTAADVVEKIAKVKEQGVSHFNVLHIAADTMDERLEQMQRFAEDVMPHLS
jgi:probable F420-dependent oxidoreductase